MSFFILAVSIYGHDRTRLIIGADDVWSNFDQVVLVDEQLDSNMFAAVVRDGIAPEEHYPCAELTTSNGSTYAMSLGVHPNHAAGFAALTRFMPSLIGTGTDEETQLVGLLAVPPSAKGGL
ncbi:hypothetical protein [Cryobacterium sp. GrIS_2_6]|uniref:hypothetical protein n=1 Tax=Cryobacterium sp. GrIS_2_6 TaxID=3162785 RepID=UPI002E03440B|nr:hypothetical protein [Cryobacterium psychrotolerans]